MLLEGLFARTTFREREKIIYFVGGLFINLNEFDGESAGHKPYILHSKKVDFFNTRAQNQCLASVSNSPSHACFNIVTQKMATANCTLKVSHNRDGPKFSLEAITSLNAHDEILWSYGADYEYSDIHTYTHV